MDRTAKHLVARIANTLSGKVEVSCEMAAAELSGMRSFISSHKFWYVFPHAAVDFVLKHREAASSSMDVDAEDGLPDTAGAEHQDAADEVFDSLGAPNVSVLPAADIGMEVACDANHKLAGVPKHIIYLYRGDVLQQFAFREYGSLVSVDKKIETKEHDGAGRPFNKTFEFSSAHPLTRLTCNGCDRNP